MQLCSVSSWGLFGGGALREIRSRSNDRPAHLRPDADGNHVLGDLFPAPYACVVTLRDDVDESIVDGDLDMDVGVLRQELR